MMETEIQREKQAKAARNAREKLAEIERGKKELTDEYIALKSNYMAINAAHEKEVHLVFQCLLQ